MALKLTQQGFPKLTKDELVDLGGWALLKEARGLAEADAVSDLSWEPPVFKGRVQPSGTPFHPRINLRSLTFAENACNCSQGRQGFVCAHALAILIAAAEADKAPTAPSRAMSDKPSANGATSPTEPAGDKPGAPKADAARVTSLVLSPHKGLPLKVRVILPPNLEKTAPRDAIVAKIEFDVKGERSAPEKLDRGRAYHLGPHQYAAVATLEGICEGKLFGMLQLKRAQLRELLRCLEGEPSVFWANAPEDAIEWMDDVLPGVSELLAEQKPEEVENASTGSRSARNDAVRGVLRKRRQDDVESDDAKPAISVPREGERRAGGISARRSGLGERRGAGALPMKQSKSGASGLRRAAFSSEGEAATTQTVVDGSPNFLAISLPSRSDPSYQTLLDLLKSSGFRLEPSNRKWWLRDRHKVLNFLAQYGETLETQFAAVFTESYKRQMKPVKRAELSVETHELAGEYSLEMSLGIEGADDNLIMRAAAHGSNYVDTGKSVYLIAPETFDRMRNLQRSFSGDASKVFAPRYSRRLSGRDLRDAEELLGDDFPPEARPESWRKKSEALRSIGNLQPAPIDKDLEARLRTYQLIGVAWLWHLYHHGLGGILADEMGLGKTVQALALLACVVRERDEPCLVVCPAGLVENWRREAVQFTPHLKVFVNHGTNRISEPVKAEDYDIIITSYATLVRDVEVLGACTFATVIADEAQHIKNRRSQNARTLRALHSEGRFLLTGTPIENSLADLRSLFEFLMPGYLAPVPSGAKTDERQWFDMRHRTQAAHYILRREKKLVATDLPDKIDQVVYCQLGSRQRKVYNDLHQRTEREIFEMEMSGANENKVRFAALTQLLRLRQACADPRIIDDKLKAADSAKLEAFLEILDEATDDGHRILVFSQFVTVLKAVAHELDRLKYRYCYLDGQTKDRLKVVDTFNGDDSIPVFLISLKAGGTGLNLTGADTVVHFDPWWNPAVEAQATDRAHRIGQTKVVTSIKLIASGTVEEKVLELQRQKYNLLRDLLDESVSANASVGLSDIKDLLKSD